MLASLLMGRTLLPRQQEKSAIIWLPENILSSHLAKIFFAMTLFTGIHYCGGIVVTMAKRKMSGNFATWRYKVYQVYISHIFSLGQCVLNI